jgi:hypothetical protein
MDEVFKSLQPYVQFLATIHSEEKVLSVTLIVNLTKFDGYRPNYAHLTPKVDRNDFCPVLHRRFTKQDTVDLLGTGESGKATLNSFRQVTRKRHQVAFDSEHSLRL